MKSTGKVTGIVSNLVTVLVDGPVSQNEICHIECEGTNLMADLGIAHLQVKREVFPDEGVS